MRACIGLSPYSIIFCHEWKINPSRNDYNIVIDQTLFGEISELQLRDALERLTKDYVLLHSRIIEKSGQYYWLEDAAINIPLQYSSIPLNHQELLGYVQQPFDLAQGHLARILLVKLQQQKFRLILVVHHLLMDGINLSVWLEEISNYYNNKSHQAMINLSEQRHLLARLNNDLEEKLNYHAEEGQQFWQNTLNGVEGIDIDFLKSATQKPKTVAEHRFSFSQPFYQTIRKLKSQYGVTPYLLGQVVFAVLLRHYAEKTKIPISYSVAIREGSSFMYGTQVNTNIIVFNFNQNTTVQDLLEQARSHFKAKKKGNCHYHLVGDILSTTDCTGLLTINFSQTDVDHKPFNFSGINKIESNYALKVDLSMPLMVGQEIRNDQINYYFRYDAGQIDKELLLSFVKNYCRLFTNIVDDLCDKKSDALIDHYKIISPREYQQVIYDWNPNSTKQASHETLHKMFEKQVTKNPHHIALVYKNIAMTYDELNKKANQLANYLKQNCGVHENQLISLYLDKTIDLPMVILAVLKAGCAYVPIDPSYPNQRTRYIVDDAKSTLLISNKNHSQKLSELFQNTRLLLIDDPILEKKLAEQPDSIAYPDTKASDLLYIIYTSGTTGNPKGVMQSHHNVAQLFTRASKRYVFQSNDVWVLFHSYAFDFSVWELWGALLYGAKLIIPTQEQITDLHLFYKLCYQKKVTVLNQTPKAFYQFITIASDKFETEKLTQLRYVILGGDTLVINNLKNWFTIYQSCKTQVINMYGSTETTVHATYQEITDMEDSHLSLIGTAIPGKQLFVLNKSMQPLPIGAIGELYIGGEGLAYGYLNRPDLTKEKFVANPFQTPSEKKHNRNNRLYKSGDLVRWLPDGRLAYIGRNDHQVKIRGYRVELGEIEAKLLEYSDISQALVMQKQLNDENHLVAYYVAKQPVAHDALQEYLALYLPAYMIPRFLIYLKKLPLTTHGKLDKNALPKLPIDYKAPYESPHNDKEKQIVMAFEKILKRDRIGINDNFLELGGDSLKAISLVSALQKNFRITVSDVFRFKTPKSLAWHIPSSNNFLYQCLEKVKKNYQTTPSHYNNIIQRSQVNEYLRTIAKEKFSLTQKKAINNVLLTGATGYLGSYLLFNLLTTTNYTIYLIIRGDSRKSALKRLSDKYQYYFQSSLDRFLGSRLHVLAGDLSKKQLGLSLENYTQLANTIDSVIHAAALVKHYGEASKFYDINVQTTRNLLEFTSATGAKDFHYISTISILTEQELYSQNFCFFTEDNQQMQSSLSENIYIKTKLEGEQIVIQYRNHGISSNIYRLGNLAFATDGSIQKNCQDNSFFNRIKCLLALGLIVPELAQVEISPVDTTANAIVRLFDCQQLTNTSFHIFNPHFFDLANFFSGFHNKVVKTCDMDHFIKAIINHLDHEEHRPLIERFLLHVGWLNEKCHPSVHSHVLQDRTQALLKLLNAEWRPITAQLFEKYLSNFDLLN